MPRDTPIRFGVALLLCMSLGPGLAAQVAGASRGRPPATPPPAQQADQAASVPTPAMPQTPAQRPPRRAEVTYEQGQLAITADNSSLNQILREIARETGMKITGGVADERVFGKYGPSPASEVIASLLDGTGSNMLLVQNDSASPGELILTPRHGEPTPPNPNAPGFEDEGEADEAPQPQQQPDPQPAPASAPTQPTQGPNQPAPATPATSDPGSAPAATDATDPNGVKTPQQIFQQLQRMRQQSQQSPQQ